VRSILRLNAWAFGSSVDLREGIVVFDRQNVFQNYEIYNRICDLKFDSCIVRDICVFEGFALLHYLRCYFRYLQVFVIREILSY